MVQRFSRLIAALRRHPVGVVLVLASVALLGWGGTVVGRNYWARQHFLAAQQALDRDDLALAQHHLDLCLKVWSDRADVHLRAALTARRRDAYDAAARHLSLCEQLGGKTDATALERDLLVAQQGDPDRVRGRLESVAANRPSLGVPVWEAIAKGYLNSYCKAESLESVDRLLRLAPDSAAGRLWRGKALESLDRTEEAACEYERAVQLAPKSDEARLRLAGALHRLGRPWDAAAQYEELRQGQPANPDILLGLSRCRHELHELDEARRLLDRLLDEHPDHVPALFDRGRLEFHAGRNVDAERWLRRASDLAPRDHDVCLCLCQCLEAEERETEARVCRERLRQIEDEFRETDDLIEKAKLAPEDAALRYRIGARLKERGQEEDAVSWFFASLGEDPHYGPAHAVLADYFERTGQHYRASLHRQADAGSGRR